ncbi:MAG TPA: methionine ABC transporter permease [Clostridiales bacterium]|nr:methionine ABC transporter permease [Clostridiales bacterium]HBP52384.1 methionine ABC transporter permease [Clostridiales bacterium]HBW05773.1 methionine ABC transporter permease [Clostridiales bacterium]HCH92314.1 methionine ABC transporter permease [Clostridiales bacterium]
MTFAEIMTMTGETLAMTLLSTLFAYILGLPCGILLNATSKHGLKPCRWLNFTLGLAVNILRSVPCLIVIVLCIPWTRAWFGKGTGEWFTIIIPMTVCAFGFVARMVEQSLAEVPAGEIEAVKSLGATDFQLITKVILPEAKVSLITGVAVVAVSILGYTSFAYNIGAGGLISGVYTFYTRNTGDYLSSPSFWVLIVIVVIIVQIIQEAGLKIAKLLDKRRLLK